MLVPETIPISEPKVAALVSNCIWNVYNITYLLMSDCLRIHPEMLVGWSRGRNYLNPTLKHPPVSSDTLEIARQAYICPENFNPSFAKSLNHIHGGIDHTSSRGSFGTKSRVKEEICKVSKIAGKALEVGNVLCISMMTSADRVGSITIDFLAPLQGIA